MKKLIVILLIAASCNKPHDNGTPTLPEVRDCTTAYGMYENTDKTDSVKIYDSGGKDYLLHYSTGNVFQIDSPYHTSNSYLYVVKDGVPGSIYWLQITALKNCEYGALIFDVTDNKTEDFGGYKIR